VRLACVLVQHFSAATVVRSEPGLRDHPLAIAGGTAPARVIVDAMPEARAAGVVPGIPEAQARARCPDLIIRTVSEERDRLAHTALLTTALGTSPRVEDGGPGVVYVDLGGIGRLFGDEAAIGERLWRQARSIGLSASVGIASTRARARAAARLGAAVTRLAPDGETAALDDAPLDLLELPADLHARLRRWGVQTLSDLAQLPRAGLASRLGAAGLEAHDLARGVDRAPFRLYTPPPLFQEAEGIEWEITSIDHFQAVVQGPLDRLVTRLCLSHLTADRLTLALGLANGTRDERTITLAHPLDDGPTILTLLRLELERHPVSSPIVHVVVSAHPVHVAAQQGRLGRPPGPGARDLTAVLARLSGLVGPANLGSPALLDSHRPGGFQVLPFDPSHLSAGAASPLAPSATSGGPEKLLVVRRLRPWLAAEVEMYAERPIWMTAGSVAGHVVACAGPWRTSGEWWRHDPSDSGEPSDAGGWAHDEWDIALSDRTLGRLVWDHRARGWFLAAIYD
jgi:protein ImuB